MMFLYLKAPDQCILCKYHLARSVYETLIWQHLLSLWVFSEGNFISLLKRGVLNIFVIISLAVMLNILVLFISILLIIQALCRCIVVSECFYSCFGCSLWNKELEFLNQLYFCHWLLLGLNSCLLGESWVCISCVGWHLSLSHMHSPHCFLFSLLKSSVTLIFTCKSFL